MMHQRRRSATAPRTPNRLITLEDKLAIISATQSPNLEGVLQPIETVAERFGVSASLVYRLLRSRNSILEQAMTGKESTESDSNPSSPPPNSIPQFFAQKPPLPRFVIERSHTKKTKPTKEATPSANGTDAPTENPYAQVTAPVAAPVPLYSALNASLAPPNAGRPNQSTAVQSNLPPASMTTSVASLSASASVNASVVAPAPVYPTLNSALTSTNVSQAAQNHSVSSYAPFTGGATLPLYPALNASLTAGNAPPTGEGFSVTQAPISAYHVCNSALSTPPSIGSSSEFPICLSLQPSPALASAPPTALPPQEEEEIDPDVLVMLELLRARNINPFRVPPPAPPPTPQQVFFFPVQLCENSTFVWDANLQLPTLTL